ELQELVNPMIENITQEIAKKIIELNGGKSVSAVFVVGGGGKIKGFVESLSKYLNLPKERVALRGEEVLGDINLFHILSNHIKLISFFIPNCSYNTSRAYIKSKN
ncbi:hypothetical protein CG709_15105, partial [Lachnotalea glycerini]